MFVIILLLIYTRFYPVIVDKTVNVHIYTQIFATDDRWTQEKNQFNVYGTEYTTVKTQFVVG